MLKEIITLRRTKMTIVIHKTEASKLAYEVSKLGVKEVWEFVDTLKTISGQYKDCQEQQDSRQIL
jgi:hypothetical protein